ncbi:MAG: hypothetical protein Q8922_06700 [Bacteroidota bacterium]|nr:hypothetical protein [Bacteroidota bacterium]MDP4232717.1 hypothetical protein [Bacteroidota bacterium]MDP4243150.1 hypothetical protein [Bacteroidota bacterium]MDP4287607.1 hypothetical protein [Bacteroidota bacterium]
MKKIVFSLLMCISFLGFVSILKAQPSCPSSNWTGPTGWTYSLPGGCGITVWWCDSADVSFIEEIDISGDTSACTDYGNILLSADSAVQAYPLRSMPLCSDGTTISHSVWQAYCWSPQIATTNARQLLPCSMSSWTGFCVKTCQLCRTFGARGNIIVVTSNCSYSSIGFPPDCEIQPPAPALWQPGHCYIANCPN